MRAALLAMLAVVALPAAAHAAVVALPSGFQDEAALNGFNQPTAFRFAPDGEVFVAEKGGQILRYDNLEDPTPTVFADLREQVYDNRRSRPARACELDPEVRRRPSRTSTRSTRSTICPGRVATLPGRLSTLATTETYEGDHCPKPSDADVDDLRGRRAPGQA